LAFFVQAIKRLKKIGGTVKMIVKIKDREFEVAKLNMLDAKRIDEAKEKQKMGELDFQFYMLLYALKKADPNLKMTLDEFLEMLDVDKTAEIIKQIRDLSGLEKFFKSGDAKKK
jgi:hypothetical protein